MLSRFYLVLGFVIIAAYALVTFSGKEFGDPQRQQVPADFRQSPGGYRTYHHFWHSGYHGGK